MSALREFSPAGYRALIGEFLSRGYTVRDFKEAESTAKHLIVRHDVDMSLEAAVEIGTIEHEIGINAHYFVLLRGELYNLFSDTSLTAVESLLAMGHKIGLHLDASLYSEDELEEAAQWESGCLQCITGCDVDMISFHRPAKSLLGRTEPLADRLHTYQPKFFSEMAYCSDSRGEWGHGHPFDLDAVTEGRALQLLTHPVWWTNNTLAAESLDTLLISRVKILDQYLATNCATHIPGRLASLVREK